MFRFICSVLTAGLTAIAAIAAPATNKTNRLLSPNGTIAVELSTGSDQLSYTVFKDGKVVECIDESTGGTHFSLVLAGAKGMTFDDAATYGAIAGERRYHYLFHTRIYWANTHILRDVSMNTRVSQGCVRLYDEDAKWIWDNVPEGTTVVCIE